MKTLMKTGSANASTASTFSSEETRPSRLRRIALALLVVVVASSFGLLLGEVMVRLIAPQQLILKRPDLWYGVDSLGWIKRGLVDTRLNTGEKEIHVYTDSAGQRIGSAGAKAGPPTVLLLGDSFMEALQVEYEESVAGRLQATLGTALGNPVAVRNTAVSGWGPDQYLLQVRRSLARERINVVVAAIFVGNDLIKTRTPLLPARTPIEVHRFRLPRRPSWPELVDAFLYPVNDFLEVRSQLFILARLQTAALRMKLGLSPEKLPEIYYRAQSLRDFLGVTTAVCDSIAAAGRAGGAETIFVLLPESFQVQADDAARFLKGSGVTPAELDLDRPSLQLAAALSAKGLRVVDAMPALRAVVDSGPRLYGKVDRHFSPDGHRIVTNLIFPLVLERLAHKPTVRPRPRGPNSEQQKVRPHHLM